MNAKTQDSDVFSSNILNWYYTNMRDLPWRQSANPYDIWLSEVILQQTRVDQGLPYYLRFVEQLPSVEKLAEAPLEKILKLWQGLGYYSRARNMHECAKMVVNKYNGQFPSSYSELLKLKGIGKYTAAAIGSICFDLPTPTIDGNAYRVLSRVFGMDADISKAASFNVFYNKAASLMPGTIPGDFNQAVMEFGATACLPRNPYCEACIFQKTCFAYKHDLIQSLPVKSKKLKIRKRYFNYLVLIHKNEILIRQRQAGDIWQGLFEFLLIENDKTLSLQELGKAGEVARLAKTECVENYPTVKHVLTHQQIFAGFHLIKFVKKRDYMTLKKSHQMTSVKIDQIDEYPVPKLIETFIENVLNLAK